MPTLGNPWKQNPWFESVAVAQQRARKRLPKPATSRSGMRV
jgi:pre-mycofactocin synthase